MGYIQAISKNDLIPILMVGCTVSVSNSRCGILPCTCSHVFIRSGISGRFPDISAVFSLAVSNV